jgi:hypothetical protein
MSLGWLKVVGLDLVKGFEIVSGIEPLIAGLLPAGSAAAGVAQTVSADLAQIGNIIVSVEGAAASVAAAAPAAGAALTAAQKLAAAVPGVTQVILQSTLLAGRTIENQSLFTASVAQVINGIVGILNSLHANVATTAKS